MQHSSFVQLGVFGRFAEMRRQNAIRALLKCVLQFLERTDDQNVGVEVGDSGSRVAVKQQSKHKRFYRRVELGHVIPGEHLGQARYPYLLKCNKLKRECVYVEVIG